MIALLIALILIGVVVWLIGQIPMDPAIMNIIRVVAILVAVLLVLQAFGIIGGSPILPRGQLRLP